MKEWRTGRDEDWESEVVVGKNLTECALKEEVATCTPSHSRLTTSGCSVSEPTVLTASSLLLLLHGSRFRERNTVK